jgi:glycosyltransferase involved in cell wall biosynthesis
MTQLSVVIIALNAAAYIDRCVTAARHVSDDVMVMDSGSTDGTAELASKAGARVIHTTWKGYGGTKNEGNAQAKHDWILSLDADEVINAELEIWLKTFTPHNNRSVYSVRRLNHIGSHPVRFGSWGKDYTIRVFNRQEVHWNDALVHEALVLPSNVERHTASGVLIHYTVKDMDDLMQKTRRYAELSARKYQQRGRKANVFNTYVGPVWKFFVNFILKLGFLDGLYGLRLALAKSYEAYLKYSLLAGFNHTK